MKKIIVTGLLALGSGFLFASGRRRSQRTSRHDASVAPDAALTREEVVRRFMLPLIVPVWIGAGLADYLWHRHTNIEKTAGTRESIVHMLMLLEGAPIVVGGSLLEINAGVLALMLALTFVHEATAMFDVGFTAPRRVIFPGEQHTHSFLEVLPFAVVALFAAVYWEQFLALFGAGQEKPRFDIRLREPHIPAGIVTLVMSAVTLFDVLPHAEELWRCWQAERRGLSGSETPECAPALYGDRLIA